ncbi:DUF3781 domain-containing protein [Lactiplantibacillus paraplantarum]|uniref:DUF3781 domain-containing protein n=1 Tax=Lactiplantibacillus paraplantarum TaxID=60520 RepID=A0AAD0X8R5_9LACO|nr:DUF3781 domain-containing protein [Lactiplantibacillus paraplantarum]AVW11326.1 DUF3781 domain-containing protein [Lactiplantibacillus paraplantarum]AYJ39740.1 DUF3781 domain-containing protein [Lactiplantibacillus paraplantarum]ERL45731.1 hypothetical protein N644_0102 [Lactiplantibacillus paraplantarum]MCU4684820.1 DUF3781 domain-containing protein [Lactiplantibacillus paraplantarum]MDL2062997.1 DUF3781 domain-containing protein [Lactiplantibacillus paraplantarum]
MSQKSVVLDSIRAYICYTPRVFQRVNKKLAINLSEAEIKELVNRILVQPDEVKRCGKNYYIRSCEAKVELTVNAGNYRLITASKYGEVNGSNQFKSTEKMN